MATTRVTYTFKSLDTAPEDEKKRKNKKKSKKAKKGKKSKANGDQRRPEGLDEVVGEHTATKTPACTRKVKKVKPMQSELEECTLSPTPCIKPKHIKKLKRSTKTSKSAHKCESKSIALTPVTHTQSVLKDNATTGRSLKSLTQKDSACVGILRDKRLARKDVKGMRQRDKARPEKRVLFDPFPEWIEPKKTRTAEIHIREVMPRVTAVFPNYVWCGEESQDEAQLEEHLEGSEATADDINSQDLFITQKSFSTPEPESDPVEEFQFSKSQQASPLRKTTSETGTQTENFFTSVQPSTSLRFHLLRMEVTCAEEPLDLSMPRCRGLDLCSHTRTRCDDDGGSQAGMKITDTALSDDSDTLSRSKADLSHLKVVQTRLNESFFFKVKGEADSPKPESPLMKFTESIERKTKTTDPSQRGMLKC